LFLLETGYVFAEHASKEEGAQQQLPESRAKIRVQSDLVLLSVNVRDTNGNLVSGLKQADFHVFDDEVEQKITAFTDEGLPISSVILVDRDTKWKDGTPMANSLGAIAGALSVADEAIVCRYDLLFYAGEKFTSVSDNLLGELKATQAVVAPPPPYVPEPVISEPTISLRPARRPTPRQCTLALEPARRWMTRCFPRRNCCRAVRVTAAGSF
jgi:hypothetical protein